MAQSKSTFALHHSETVSQGARQGKGTTTPDAKKTELLTIQLPRPSRYRAIWCLTSMLRRMCGIVCTDLKGRPRFRLDDPVLDALLTDHVHRVGRPKESIKGVRLRLAAEAYKNADMARDPLD